MADLRRRRLLALEGLVTPLFFREAWSALLGRGREPGGRVPGAPPPASSGVSPDRERLGLRGNPEGRLREGARGTRRRVRVDGRWVWIGSDVLFGWELLHLSGLPFQAYDLQMKFGDGRREMVEMDEELRFPVEGLQRFETVPLEAQQGGR